MILIRDIKIKAKDDKNAILDRIADILDLYRIYPDGDLPDMSYEPVKRSVDARHRPEIYLIYTVKVLIGDEDEKIITDHLFRNKKSARIRKSLEKIITGTPKEYCVPKIIPDRSLLRPVIIGSGPAGLFCALYLARCGIAPVVIEQGEDVIGRKKSVEKFWKMGELSPYSNVQFGEGGAGTFSDGKLNTLTKDINGRNTFVLKTFYEFGAPKDITVDSKPHIGTDILVDVVANIRKEIIDLGGEVYFKTKFINLGIKHGAVESVTVRDLSSGIERQIATGTCVLAIGHSARDTFEMLYGLGIPMTSKSFAAGFRIVHPQKQVNLWQYAMEDPSVMGLKNADYKLACTASNGRRVYSFCMCPGGYVVNASSEHNRLCVNGMSESNRGAPYANSAIIAAVSPDDFVQDTVPKDHPLSGMYYQRKLEEEAFRRGRQSIPYQSFDDFAINNDCPLSLDIHDAVKGACTPAPLRGIFSDDIDNAIIESVRKFGYTMKGFDDTAVLLGVESRTSSPVRITRDDDLTSTVKGLYPCGEGAGYAGGITSAAADGLKVAEMIAKRYER